jgi:hypothetical protein
VGLIAMHFRHFYLILLGFTYRILSSNFPQGYDFPFQTAGREIQNIASTGKVSDTFTGVELA